MTPSQQAALEQVAREYIQCLPFTGTLGEYDNAVRKLVTLLAAQRAAVLEEAIEECARRAYAVGHNEPLRTNHLCEFLLWLKDKAKEQRP